MQEDLENVAEAPSEDIGEVVQAFEDVLKRAPGTFWAAYSLQALGEIYVAVGATNKARAAYEKITRDYDSFGGISTMAWIYLARTYESEGNWEEAQRIYQELLSVRYAWTPVWMEAPLYPGQLFERRNNYFRAKEAYERALIIFKKRLERAPTPDLEAKTRLYMQQAQEGLARQAEPQK